MEPSCTKGATCRLELLAMTKRSKYVWKRLYSESAGRELHESLLHQRISSTAESKFMLPSSSLSTSATCQQGPNSTWLSGQLILNHIPISSPRPRQKDIASYCTLFVSIIQTTYLDYHSDYDETGRWSVSSHIKGRCPFYVNDPNKSAETWLLDLVVLIEGLEHASPMGTLLIARTAHDSVVRRGKGELAFLAHIDDLLDVFEAEKRQQPLNREYVFWVFDDILECWWSESVAEGKKHYIPSLGITCWSIAHLPRQCTIAMFMFLVIV